MESTFRNYCLNLESLLFNADNFSKEEKNQCLEKLDSLELPVGFEEEGNWVKNICKEFLTSGSINTNTLEKVGLIQRFEQYPYPISGMIGISSLISSITLKSADKDKDLIPIFRKYKTFFSSIYDIESCIDVFSNSTELYSYIDQFAPFLSRKESKSFCKNPYLLCKKEWSCTIDEWNVDSFKKEYGWNEGEVKENKILLFCNKGLLDFSFIINLSTEEIVIFYEDVLEWQNIKYAVLRGQHCDEGLRIGSKNHFCYIGFIGGDAEKWSSLLEEIIRYKKRSQKFKIPRKEELYPTIYNENIDGGIPENSTLESIIHTKVQESLSLEEQEYLDTLKESLTDDGEISERERKLLDKIRKMNGISEARAKELEEMLSAPQLTDEEQEYLNEYRNLKAEREISEKERRLLDKILKLGGISYERARELEQMV